MTESSPYAPPSSVVRDPDALPLSMASESAQRALYAAFAQSDHYVAKWHGRLDGTSKWAGFNWPAAIFGIVWCFYRKLYLLGIAVMIGGLVVSFVTGIIIGLFIPALLVSSLSLTLIGFAVVALFIRLPLGFAANRVYFRRATRVIAGCVGQRDATACVGSRGGTSEVALIVAIVISVAMRFVLSMA